MWICGKKFLLMWYPQNIRTTTYSGWRFVPTMSNMLDFPLFDAFRPALVSTSRGEEKFILLDPEAFPLKI
jgi:hypothetical protein